METGRLSLPLGVLYGIELVASFTDEVPFTLIPLVTLSLVAPAAIVASIFAGKVPYISTLVGMRAVVRFLIVA